MSLSKSTFPVAADTPVDTIQSRETPKKIRSVIDFIFRTIPGQLSVSVICLPTLDNSSTGAATYLIKMFSRIHPNAQNHFNLLLIWERSL